MIIYGGCSYTWFRYSLAGGQRILEGVPLFNSDIKDPIK